MAEVEFFGEKFGIVAEPNEFAMMEYDAASTAIDLDPGADPVENAAAVRDARAAIFALLEESIVPEDWRRFRAHARKNRADLESLFPVIAAVYEQATERPTGQPADSSAGLPSTPPRSELKPIDQAIARLEGRPDQQVAVLRSRRSA